MFATVGSLIIMLMATGMVALAGYVIIIGDREEAEKKKAKKRSK